MKIVGYYVTKGGVPCAFRNVNGRYRAGILVPISDPAAKTAAGVPAPVAYLDKKRDARRAIARSITAAESLRGSLVEDWARENVPSYFTAGTFEIQPLAKQ